MSSIILANPASDINDSRFITPLVRPPMTEVHVDDWISRSVCNYGDPAIQYAACALLLMRLPAVEKAVMSRFIRLPLYCDYNGVRVRVVVASRMGDIGITTDLNSEQYQERVLLSKCSNWGNSPLGYSPLVSPP